MDLLPMDINNMSEKEIEYLESLIAIKKMNSIAERVATAENAISESNRAILNLANMQSKIDTRVMIVEKQQAEDAKLKNTLGSGLYPKLCRDFDKRMKKRVLGLLGWDTSSAIYITISDALYSEINCDIKERFNVASRKDISMDDYLRPGSIYDSALSFVENWKPSRSFYRSKLNSLVKKNNNGYLSANKAKALTDFLLETDNGENVDFLRD